LELWNKCSEKLENSLSQDDFNTWIRPLRANIDQDTLEVVAPNDFILDYIEKNFADEIKEIIKNQEKRDISLVFKTLTKETFVDKYKNKSSNKDIKLVETYIFDNFVEGKSNHLALAAAKQVASNPKGDYNPLFIYGGVGLGKTHLMHAVGNEILKNEPKKRIVYVHSEKFVSDMVKALQLGAMNEFKSFYRNADALLIDDIQFFAGKEQSQEEFFHTFNALLDRNNQMILTCDKYPKEIDGLEERLKSRLGWGLPVVIDPPELETRAAVLLKKAYSMGVPLPNDCAIYIAQRIRSNIRELEGALKRVVANARFTNQDVDLALVKDSLKDLFVISAKMVSIENIQKTVAEYYNIRLSDLLSKRRSRSITRPRQMAMALTKELTNHSLPEIGESFNGRDHTTVIHACKKISELRKENPSHEEDYRNLNRALTN
jgi:chromosomal replication initiator protein